MFSPPILLPLLSCHGPKLRSESANILLFNRQKSFPFSEEFDIFLGQMSSLLEIQFSDFIISGRLDPIVSLTSQLIVLGRR